MVRPKLAACQGHGRGAHDLKKGMCRQEKQRGKFRGPGSFAPERPFDVRSRRPPPSSHGGRIQPRGQLRSHAFLHGKERRQGACPRKPSRRLVAWTGPRARRGRPPACRERRSHGDRVADAATGAVHRGRRRIPSRRRRQLPRGTETRRLRSRGFRGVPKDEPQHLFRGQPRPLTDREPAASTMRHPASSSRLASGPGRPAVYGITTILRREDPRGLRTSRSDRA